MRKGSYTPHAFLHKVPLCGKREQIFSTELTENVFPCKSSKIGAKQPRVMPVAKSQKGTGWASRYSGTKKRERFAEDFRYFTNDSLIVETS